VLNVVKIWEPKPPGTLWATPGLLRDSFTLTFSFKYITVHNVCANLKLCTFSYCRSQSTMVDELKFVPVPFKPAVIYTKTVLTIIYKEPTRCDLGQYCFLLTTASSLYMSRTLSASIIRSIKNCTSSHWCVAASTVFSTPDDGRGKRPRHVERTCSC